MTDPHHSALTVVIPFATLILLGRKRWELRKMTCASAVGKKVPIIASKTHRIWGLVTVEAVEWKTMAELLQDPEAHRVPREGLEAYTDARDGCYVWKLRDPEILLHLMPVARRSGSVNWVRLSPETCAQLAAAPKCPDLDAMNPALLHGLRV